MHSRAQRVKAGLHNVVMAVTAMRLEHREPRPHSSYRWRMPESGEEPQPRSSPGALLSNWITYDAPFTAKLRMAASNTFIKLRKRQACCGNNGQPGC
jgi:hypothetical protein